MSGNEHSGRFVFTPEGQEAEAVGTVLYREHLRLTDKALVVPFAGYLMPLWYDSISSEHTAVRETAGLFDCTHMGVIEIAGPDACRFINIIATNDVRNISVGAAQYSYVLDAAGNILDDIIVYRRGDDKYMMVVNAANEPKIKAYLSALQNGKVCIDADDSDRKFDFNPMIRDMRDVGSGGGGDGDWRVDIALQGPLSMDILVEMVDDESKNRLVALRPFRFIEAPIAGIDCIISRTGYTGAKIGFELFVHPSKAPELWNKILETGRSSGLVPCGLGSRDSLRIEAGLPLYGHELAGEFDISPFEAGYGWAAKVDKEFFIGKSAMEREAASYDGEVVRLELPGAKGIRPVRQHDGVLDESGGCVGWVLSCAKVGGTQIALAYVRRDSLTDGDSVGVYYVARNQRQVSKGRKERVEKDASLSADISGNAVCRFAKF